MREIDTSRAERIRAHARRVRELVANACATTTAALGIEKVHEPNAEAQTRQQCTVIAEHGQLLQVFR
jgi:hypothetical protein